LGIILICIGMYFCLSWYVIYFESILKSIIFYRDILLKSCKYLSQSALHFRLIRHHHLNKNRVASVHFNLTVLQFRQPIQQLQCVEQTLRPILLQPTFLFHLYEQFQHLLTTLQQSSP
jgi:hypothetical protein